MVGAGTYDDAARHSSPTKITEDDSLVLDLRWLIHAKRAAGRTKDLEAIAELELLQDPDIRAAAEAAGPSGKPRRR